MEGTVMSDPITQTHTPISRPESITAVELHMMPRDEDELINEPTGCHERQPRGDNFHEQSHRDD